MTVNSWLFYCSTRISCRVSSISFITVEILKLLGLFLETWVFVAIFALIGLIVATLGLHQEENLALIFSGLTIIGSSSLIFIKKIKNWVEKI
jgi:hypothetical protein